VFQKKRPLLNFYISMKIIDNLAKFGVRTKQTMGIVLGVV
jgi:hypothetical protein